MGDDGQGRERGKDYERDYVRRGKRKRWREGRRIRGRGRCYHSCLY